MDGYSDMEDGIAGPDRNATVLREDFAGTSAESVAWVALREGRRALAIDVDGATLDWARRRAERILGMPDLESWVAYVVGIR